MAEKPLWSAVYIGSTSSKNSAVMTPNSELCQTFSSAVRALSQSNDMMVKGILEQNKVLNDGVKIITDQMREITLVNKQLTSTNKSLVEELKNLKKETDTLKLEKSIKSETPALTSQPVPNLQDHIGQQHVSNLNRLPQTAFQTLSPAPYQPFPTNLSYGLSMSGQSVNQIAQNYLSTVMNLQQMQQQAANLQPQMPQHNLTFMNPTTVASQQPAVPTFDPFEAHVSACKSAHLPTAFSNQNAGHPSTISSAPSAKPFFTDPVAVQPKPQQPLMSSISDALKQAATPVSNSQQHRMQAAATAGTLKQPTFAQVAALPKAPTSAASATPKSTAIPASNPFASLLFGKPTTPVTTTISGPAVTTTTATALTNGIFGGGGPFSSSPGLTFAQLSQKAASSLTTDKKSTTSAGFIGASQPVFASLISSKDQGKVKEKAEGDDENDGAEDFVPTVEFKPLVPLPALVEAKTGEEEEEVLFKSRAKLFRFVNDTKEFKERGIGELKLLKNQSNGRVRLLMRRDQTLKLCANHYLDNNMKLLPLAKSDKAFTWQCHDFADNELKPETLALRFKDVEMAQKFKNIFEMAARQASSPSKQQPEKTEDDIKKVTETKTSFGEEFKIKPGTWNCPSCYLNNMADRTICVCCGGNKDGSAAKQTEPAAVDFNFTLPKSSPDSVSFNFGKATSSPTPSVAAQTFGTLSTPQKQMPLTFSFGFKTQSDSPSIFGNSPAASSSPLMTKSTSIFQNSAVPSAFDTKLFGAAKSNESQNEKAVKSEEAINVEFLPADCEGCIGCTLKEDEIDRVFEQLEKAALEGPQYPAYEDIFEDDDLMVKIES